jgi:hypothetical protein
LLPVPVLVLSLPPHAASTGKSKNEPKMTDLMVGPHAESTRYKVCDEQRFGP